MNFSKVAFPCPAFNRCSKSRIPPGKCHQLCSVSNENRNRNRFRFSFNRFFQIQINFDFSFKHSRVILLIRGEFFRLSFKIAANFFSFLKISETRKNSPEFPEISGKTRKFSSDFSLTENWKVERLGCLVGRFGLSLKISLVLLVFRIAITTKGKYTAIAADAIPNLLNLVDDNDSEVRVNVLKAITCLSEAPEGRKALLPHVEKVTTGRSCQMIFSIFPEFSLPRLSKREFSETFKFVESSVNLTTLLVFRRLEKICWFLEIGN